MPKKIDRLTLAKVAAHRHKLKQERKARPKLYPYRPVGFALIVFGVVLLCFCCIWWAVSAHIVITPKENYKSLKAMAEYKNPARACKYLRPELIYNFVGPLSYQANSTRWQPLSGMLKNGQLYYETCNYQNDEVGLHAGLGIYEYIDASHAGTAWQVLISKSAGITKQPLDYKKRESFMLADTKTLVLNGKQIIVLSYDATVSTKPKVIPPERVKSFVAGAMNSVDFFQQKETQH